MHPCQFSNWYISCLTAPVYVLKTAGMVDQETKCLLKNIYKKCAICHKYTHPKMKLIVSFNPAIALDLHELGPDLWYLHMIDLFNRLSTAVVFCSKEMGVIVDEFMQNWVSIYGAPEIGLFTDNGLEFNNKTFQEMAEKLNLSLKTTAAYSLWSNGIVECHNAIPIEIIKKVKEENVISWETATSWAVNAKNCLVNVHGFSPYQIMYSRNQNLSSNIINKPLALENKLSVK